MHVQTQGSSHFKKLNLLLSLKEDPEEIPEETSEETPKEDPVPVRLFRALFFCEKPADSSPVSFTDGRSCAATILYTVLLSIRHR